MQCNLHQDLLENCFTARSGRLYAVVESQSSGPLRSERSHAVAERGSPSVRRRQLAAELRRLRERAGLTGDQAAVTLGWSPSKISRLETSQTGISADDLRKLIWVRMELPQIGSEIDFALHIRAAQ